MAPYRAAPASPPRALPVSWWRLVVAWLNGTLRRAAERQFRNEVLRDVDRAIACAPSLPALFRVAMIITSHELKGCR